MDPARTIADPVGHLRLGAVVLAAGTGRRFGGHKLAALLRGQSLLQHVLDTLAMVPLVRVVVVVAPDAGWLETVSWRDALRVVNPEPVRGLSGSLRLGLDACVDADDLDGAYIVLGDQPLTAASTLVALADAAQAAIPGGSVAVVPDYDGGGGSNPVLLLRAGFALAARLSGDHGLGSVLATQSGLVYRVPLPGSNPDVDTPADLDMLEAGS